MINKKVISEAIVTKLSAVLILAVFTKNKITILMVLANTIEYKKASCTVVIARYKMRLRLDQYPFRSL